MYIYTYPNAEFGYVFSFHLPSMCAEVQLQVTKRLTLNLSVIIIHIPWLFIHFSYIIHPVYSYMSNMICQI